jgi:hypothetical protein
MTQKTYVMALKYGSANDPPPDWKERLASIQGVSSVAGTLPNRAHFTATSEAAQEVRAQFSHSFHVEEVVERDPQ